MLTVVDPIVIPEELAHLQAQAESMMTVTLEAFKPNGRTTDADGMKTIGYLSQGTSPGKVQGSSAVGKNPVTRTVSVGDVEVPVIDGGLHLPISAFLTSGGLQIKSGRQGTAWEFEVTAVGLADDPALLGRRYLAVSVPAKSYATARRLDVVEITPAPLEDE